MGRDKAWVELEGEPLIGRVIDRLRQACDELIIVANRQEHFEKLDVKLVRDAFPGKGSLGGIYSGLREARFDRVVAVACDMPFLNAELLEHMLALSTEFDAVIPSAPDASKPARWNSGVASAKDADLHPLHAVYTRACLGPIESRIRAGDLRMISFHPDVRLRIVSLEELERFDPRHLSLFNVNTPEQLSLAESLVQE